jgi:hypothetical protein
VSDEILLPPPPATNLWDVQAIAERALATLRLGGQDVDAGRVREAADTAVVKVDEYVDHVEPGEPTAAMITAAVQVTTEIYRHPPWGVLDAWSQDAIPFRVSSDPLAGVIMTILGDKQRWGIG